MSYLEEYLKLINSNEIKDSINTTVNNIVPEHIEKFSFKEHITGLLLGNVQSGKTGQMFGIIAAAADAGFKLFILLTTDNVYLQEQTYKRAIKDLATIFEICNEMDETRFLETKLRRPTLVILKKNSSILRTWKNNISSSKYCEGSPLFIIDDEGDAASMNTKINQRQLSTIYRHLTEMRKLASSSIYLQVTGTPQSIILQSKKHSDLKPSFAYYFPPGKEYMGGEFFFSDPESYVIRLTGEDELDDLKNEDEYITDGLRTAILSFLVAGAHIMLSGGKVCNFLIHPSVRISEHNAVATKIGEFLNTLLDSEVQENLSSQLKEVWLDLQKTKPDIKPFDEIKNYIQNILTDTITSDTAENKIKFIVMNSKNSQNIKYDEGMNIIVGGNSLGRGVTFEGLQTVYYCRRAKMPQADTYWQHCRMFGYNRDKGLMRLFIPPLLLKLFMDLNKSNQALIEQITKSNLDNINLLSPKNARPTRKNVIHKDTLILMVGGVNYFPSYPSDKYTLELDKILSDYTGENEVKDVPIKFLINLLEKLESEKIEEWNNKSLISCLEAVISSNIKMGKLVVRRDRDIKKGTGTLLSPNDRALGQSINHIPVLTLYRVIGQKEKGWNDNPLWIPNIKFPGNIIFYKSN